MKAKDIAALLLLHPENEVEVGVYTYQDAQDSVGSYDFSEVNTISIRKGTKFRKPTIVLTGSKIGYPDDEVDFEIIS